MQRTGKSPGAGSRPLGSTRPLSAGFTGLPTTRVNSHMARGWRDRTGSGCRRGARHSRSSVCRALPSMLSSVSTAEVSQRALPSGGNRSACTRYPAACDAMPAASSSTIQLGHCKQPAHRDPQQPEIKRAPTATPPAEPEDPAGQHGARAEPAARGDAVEKQHRLRAFAQHGEPDHHRQHIERPSAGDHCIADFAGRSRRARGHGATSRCCASRASPTARSRIAAFNSS